MKRFFTVLIVMVLFSAFATMSYGQTELLTNGGFESWADSGAAGPPDGWQLSDTEITASQEADVANIHTGTYSANITWTTTSTVQLLQGVKVTPGYTYNFSFWALDNDANGRARVAVRWYDASGGFIEGFYGDYTTDSPDWQQLSSGDLTAPVDADSATTEIRVYDVSGGTFPPATVYVDDASFTELAVVALTVSNVTREFTVPATGTDCKVTADVTGGTTPYTSVEIGWSVDGTEQTAITMTNTTGDTYEGTIPAQADGARVEYYVTATDADMNAESSTTEGFFWGVTSISTFREADAEGAILYADYYARLTGVATVASGIFSTSSMDCYIQDATGGINLYKGGAGDVTITEGNNYTVVGSLDQYNGKAEIIPDDAAADITDDGPGTMPAPVVLTIADLLADAESYESMLIQVNALDTVAGHAPWPAAGNDANIEVTDNGGTDVFVLRVDKDTNIDDNPEPVWPEDITGIFTQYDYSVPMDTGYQILPRSIDDFQAPVVPDEPPVVANVERTVVVPTADEAVVVTADITDDFGLAVTELRYQVNDGSEEAVTMTAGEGDSYSAEIPASAYSDGDRVVYYVYAEDNAETPNITESQTAGVFAGTTPIANVKVMDDQGVILYAKYYARLKGVATVGKGVFQEANLDAYIQDDAAGLNVFKYDFVPDFLLGHEYTVVGMVDQYRGKTEIIPDNDEDVTDNGESVLPAPIFKTINELLASAEDYEGMLVGVAAVDTTADSQPWPAAGSDANLEVTDPSGGVLVARVDKDSDVPGTPEPAYPTDMVGIFSQYDASAPYFEGYQVLIRYTSDFALVGIEKGNLEQLPTAFSLKPNYPNPFNPETNITFEVPIVNNNDARATFAVYNIMGQQVRTLFNEPVKAGVYHVKWDGRNENGIQLPSGVYFGVFKAEQYTKTIKMILMK
ncbi:MAG: FlgD immunoglobulin-like domain containing protein [Calditrichia bacterium]